MSTTTTTSLTTKKPRSVQSDQPSQFLMKLKEILQKERGEVIDWSKQGDQFEIKDPERFEQEIVPKYYKHNNLKSFIRQLNMHGFKKTRKNYKQEESGNFYFHPLFKRDNTDLCKYIRKRSPFPMDEDGKNKRINSLIEEQSVLHQRIAELEKIIKCQSQIEQIKTTGQDTNLETALNLLMKVIEPGYIPNGTSEILLHSWTNKLINSLNKKIERNPDEEDVKGFESEALTTQVNEKVNEEDIYLGKRNNRAHRVSTSTYELDCMSLYSQDQDSNSIIDFDQKKTNNEFEFYDFDLSHTSGKGYEFFESEH